MRNRVPLEEPLHENLIFWNQFYIYSHSLLAVQEVSVHLEEANSIPCVSQTPKVDGGAIRPAKYLKLLKNSQK